MDTAKIANAQGIPAVLWLARLWILFAAFLTAGGWLLSLGHALDGRGYLGLLVVFGIVAALDFKRSKIHFRRTFPWKRFASPLPVVFLAFLLAEIVGGLLYEPTNYDALTYRIPRMLHWLQAGQWHWTGSWNSRMDLSATGYEWLMTPIFLATGSLRGLFIPNLISFALLPGLTFSTLRGLGVSGAVARRWMWAIPCGYSFVLQAGSCGNDSFATVFLLSAITFGLRAKGSSRWSDAAVAVIAIGLLTGSKASNLPLVLPCLVVVLPVIRIFLQKRHAWLLSGCVVLIAAVVSFAPIAFLNWRHTGDWTGDPNNGGKMKLDRPVSGLIGNSLQLLVENLEPPILIGTAAINARITSAMNEYPIAKIREHFPRLSLNVNDLASEEAAALGLGISLAGMLLGLGALARPSFFVVLWKSSSGKRIGLLVGFSTWVSLAIFMAKLGSESTPRIATPFYALLLVVPLLHPFAQRFSQSAAGHLCLILGAASVLPAVILSPARPLFPVNSAIALLTKDNPDAPLAQRIRTVYQVYAHRADPFADVRDQMPTAARTIGFAGTGDDSEISFWLPLGTREVRDLVPPSPKGLPDVRNLDAIATSDWGCNDRFGRTPAELASGLGWHVSATLPVKSRAGSEARIWSVLLPETP